MRAVGKQSVQRIERDRRRALPGGDLDQPPQIGEVADPPIAARAQGIKLRRQRPVPSPVALKRAQRFSRPRSRWRAVTARDSAATRASTACAPV